MTTNNNRYFAIIFPSALLAVALVLILFMFSGCNAEKRAVKKSDKHFFTAVAWDKANVHGRCSDIAPPIVMTKDSFIYKPGKVIYKQGEPVYVEVDCDSVVKSLSSNLSPVKPVRIKCPPCDSLRVDSMYRSSHNVAVDNNKVKALEATIKDRDETISKKDEEIARLKERNRIQLYAIIILAAYTLLRWILRIWGVKLP